MIALRCFPRVAATRKTHATAIAMTIDPAEAAATLKGVESVEMMGGPDEVIHQSTRLRIMAALNVLVPDEALEFTRLRAIVQATDGNLGAHVDTLEKAGYVAIDKRFVGKRRQTRIHATKEGRRAFAAHVAYLRDILQDAGTGS